ncbi:wall associated protein [Pseudoxanthomonas wuyuanensis]|nr:wall associated protein [Pseudoxanthomonas wuyuanensis]
MGWLATVSMATCSMALAQTTPYQEYDKLVKAAEMVAPLKSDLFGDNVSLYNGATEFSVTDIDLPGNHALSVRLGRSFKVELRNDADSLGGFGAWDLEVPYMYGVFPSDYKWNTGGNTATDRCSQPFYPRVDAPFSQHEVWTGTKVHLPGQGDQTVLWNATSGNVQPTDGQAYYWNTREQLRFKCTSMLNYPGQGFIAVDSQGTQYVFNYAIERAGGVTRKPASGWGEVALNRTKIYLMATRVQDRFGNYVDYEYSGDQLNRIVASDGRIITLTYSDGRIIKASAHGRDWHYTYHSSLYFSIHPRARALTMVTLPDQSRWQYLYNGGLSIVPSIQDGSIGGPSCIEPLPDHASFGLTVTHPAGAVGEFRFEYLRHGISGTPATACVLEGVINGEQHWSLAIPDYYYLFSLDRKTITGPGLSPQQWTYAYGDPLTGRANYSGVYCTTCDQEKSVIVNQPDGSKDEYVFGVLFNYNDGRLQGKYRRRSDGHILRAELNEYVSETEVASMPFPKEFGYLSGSHDISSIQNRPIKKITVLQDGDIAGPVEWGSTPSSGSSTAPYIHQVNAFDNFARPLSVTRQSPWHTRTDVTAYHDNLSQWVLGQTLSVTNTNTSPNVVVSRAEYDGTTALPLRYYGPGTTGTSGKLVQTLTYNADGTVATVKDGNNRTTTLSDWYRGIPRSITYADTRTQSAVVNPSGWVTQVTDENGFASNYTYDAMGRLASAAYPTGDTTVWNNTTQVFEPVAANEYGIAAGHWRQTVSTGNARQVRYFDALWRPLVVREYDTANVAGTQRFSRFTYDHAGRTTFASYPGTTDALSTGTWTEYDALGRVTSVSQDSEDTPLTTLTEYLPNHQTRVTNPRNQVTLTGYQVFGQPSYDAPVWVQHPENARTDIARDVFGKPTALTRRDAGNTQLVTRSYAYNVHQELCRSVEPETGATLMGYDGAGNLAWSSAGLAAGTACEPNGTAVAVAARKVSRTYDARNRLKTLSFPDGRGNQVWDYTLDGLPDTISTWNSNGGQPVVNSYSYNKRRLLTSESISQPGYTWSLGYQYDGNGALAQLNYPSGLQVAFAPNALGQPTQAGNYATGVSYYPNGAVKQFTYGNGIVHSMTQNARQLPLRVQSGNATGYEYAYDRNGNPAQIHDLVRGTNYSRTLQYDGLDRLTAAGSAMFGGDHWHRFTYDAVDNLKSWKLAGVKDYASYYYEPNTNRLLSIQNSANAAIVGLWYDEQGNLSNKNGQQYAFDYGNRLREAANQETYRYDGHGRRVQANNPAQVPILSMYGQDGTLRRQEDHRTGKHYEYVTLAGSLVAKVTTVVAPGTPSLTTPGYSGNGSYTVSWTATPTATSYELQEAVNGGSWAAAYSGTATSQAYTGKGSGSYGYRVRACQASSCSGWSATGTTTVELPPASAPSLSVPASAPNGTYTVSWTAVGGATTYTLEESANGGSWASVQNTASQSRAYSGKAAGSYSYRVKACNPAGCGPTSAAASTQAFYSPATSPTPVASTPNTTGSIAVTWSAVATSDRYELDERPAGGAWVTVHNGPLTSKTLTGRTAGTYEYRLRACNAAGCSAYSSALSVLVVLSPTGAPTLSAPATNLTGSYTVSWGQVGAAVRHELDEQFNGGNWSTIHNAAATSLAMSGRATGTYRYRARGCNLAGCGPYSSMATVQVTRAPATAPTLSAPASSSTGSYAVSWNAIATATSYQLEQRFNTGAWGVIHDAAGTSVALTGRAVGSYDYRVRACNVAGCGPYSSLATVVVPPAPAPGTAPTLYAPGLVDVNWSYDLSWTAVAGAGNYQLEETFVGGSHWYQVYNGTGTSANMPGRGSGSYWYRVRACNGSGCSPYSSVQIVVVQDPCPAPCDPVIIMRTEGAGE